jgi:hypothetical protein
MVASVDKMRCRWCQRSIKEGETVHRVSMRYTFPWPDGPYPLIGYICPDCAKATSPLDLDPHVFGTEWLDPIPCNHCGRPVVHDIRRKLPKYVVCSEECQRQVYKTIKFKGSMDEKPCKLCGTMFKTCKSTSRYCSNRCKERMYRRRSKTSNIERDASVE